MLDQLHNDLIQAQLAKDGLKLSVLRMLLSELKYAQLSKGQDLDEAEVQAVIQKELKKRRDSVAAFTSGGRQELADREQSEIEILTSYLPAQMSEEELTKIVQQAIKDLGATEMTDMGRVIGQVVSQTAGQADGSRISGLVKLELS